MAQRVYEKGTQSLADAIKEVEKLQAAQQLTATLLPSSSVNTMSSDDDKCFQCQELGCMAQHCPRIRCFDFDEHGHVSADCPDKIPPSGTPASTGITVLTQDNAIDPHLTIIIMIGTIAMIIETDIDQDPSPAIIDTGVTVAMTHEEVVLGPITDPQASAHHTTEAQAHTATDETPHTADPNHAEVSPGIAVDPDHIHHTNTTTKHQQDHLTVPTEQP